MSGDSGRRGSRGPGPLAGRAFLYVVLSAGWLWAFPSADLFYVANVLLHVLAGIALAVGLWLSGLEIFRRVRSDRRALAVLSACAVLGGALCVVGATRQNLPLVVAHAACGFAGAAILAFGRRDRRIAAALAVALLLPAVSAVRGRWFPGETARIVNPTPGAAVDGR